MLEMATILYPTDFSTNAEAALTLASALAREGHGRLVVLRVEWPPLATLGGTAGVPPLALEYDRQGAWEELQRILPSRPGFTVEHRLAYGEPASTILKTAEEAGADLIVMGTHGRTGLRRLLMGSVAEQVVRKASCPVLTVRTPSQTLLTLPAVAPEHSPCEPSAESQNAESPEDVSGSVTTELSFVAPELEAVS